MLIKDGDLENCEKNVKENLLFVGLNMFGFMEENGV